MICPNCQTHWVIRRSENRFCAPSCISRLLNARALGPVISVLPSVYAAGATLRYGRPAWPQVGLFTLLPAPFRASTGNGTAAEALGARMTMPVAANAAATARTGMPFFFQPRRRDGRSDLAT